MSTQTGTYFEGTYGFPIEVQTGTDLTGAVSVELEITKPDGSVINRSLGTPAITDAAAGNIQFKPAQSEVDASGLYRFTLTTHFDDPEATVVAAGQFIIESTGMDGPAGLVVEDGTGKTDANTYATVAEADAYHEGHLYATDWTATNARAKATALRMATRALEAGVLWNGQRKTDEQALGWPRNYAPQPGSRVATMTLASLWPHRFWAWWPNDVIPKGLKDATCEMARELIKQDRTGFDAQKKGVKSLNLGQGAIQIALDPADRQSLFTDMVKLQLQPFGLVISANPSNVPVRIG